MECERLIFLIFFPVYSPIHKSAAKWAEYNTCSYEPVPDFLTIDWSITKNTGILLVKNFDVSNIKWHPESSGLYASKIMTFVDRNSYSMLLMDVTKSQE